MKPAPPEPIPFDAERTIADLSGSNRSEEAAGIETQHLAEAIQDRPRRQF